MSALHAAAQGFANQAECYQRGRPEYPPAIDDWLASELRVGGGLDVLDLGAGTGKFTKRLAATGARVTAVEPVAEMRAQLSKILPDVPVLEGTAEAIPLPGESLDVVVCAQAFHWFASQESLAEIHRVLKPGGRLGLVWNVRDESTPWVRAISEFLVPYEGDAPRFHHGLWRTLFPHPGFTPLAQTVFPHGHSGPIEQVIIERIMCVSFIAALPAGEQAEVRRGLQRLVDSTPELAGRQTATFPYRTEAYVCRRLG